MKLTDKQKKIIDSYGVLFNNTGGNNIIELLEREGITYFNNPILAEIQGCCFSQLRLLETLQENELLIEC